MAINKVVYGSNTLIDLSEDTISANKLAEGYTAHGASGSSLVGTMGTIGANGLTWSQLTSTVWGVVAGTPIFLEKIIDFPEAIDASTKVWSLPELVNLPITSLSDYEYLSIMLSKNSLSHTTDQVIYVHSFYPYTSYRNLDRYCYTGAHMYHSTNPDAVGSWRSATALAEAADGFFQIKSDGIYFNAVPAKRLYGSYIFTIVAKKVE